MDTRSSNAVGYVHYQGDVVSNVGSSHGVQLSGGSTGGIVQAIGDDANVSLSLYPRGTGDLVLGTSSNAVKISSGASFTLAGTDALTGIYRYTDTAVATPNFNSTNAMVIDTDHVIPGLTTNSYVLAIPRNSSTDCVLTTVKVSKSTATNVHCSWLKCSTLTVGASTATVDFLCFRF